MFAAGHCNGAELVAGGAELAHVALRDHGVTGGCAKPAIQGAVRVAVRLLIRLPGTGGRVVGQCHHGDLALPGVDRHHGVTDHADIAGAAVVIDAADAWRDTQGLGQLLRIHHLELRGRRLDEQGIHIRLVHPRITQRVANRLDIQRHRAATRMFAKRGVADTGDHHFCTQCVGHAQITSSACSCAISPPDRPSQSP